MLQEDEKMLSERDIRHMYEVLLNDGDEAVRKMNRLCYDHLHQKKVLQNHDAKLALYRGMEVITKNLRSDNGMRGTIVSIQRTRATVKLAYGEFRIPLRCLEPVK